MERSTQGPLVANRNTHLLARGCTGVRPVGRDEGEGERPGAKILLTGQGSLDAVAAGQ